MNHKPDDRRDNVDKIQYSIDKTIQNIRLADEMIEKTIAAVSEAFIKTGNPDFLALQCYWLNLLSLARLHQETTIAP